VVLLAGCLVAVTLEIARTAFPGRLIVVPAALHVDVAGEIRLAERLGFERPRAIRDLSREILKSFSVMVTCGRHGARDLEIVLARYFWIAGYFGL
jgi:hypothetical protein